MTGTEKDTFRRLQRMPYVELEQIWQNASHYRGPWEKQRVYEGWTWDEFVDEHNRRSTKFMLARND